MQLRGRVPLFSNPSTEEKQKGKRGEVGGGEEEIISILFTDMKTDVQRDHTGSKGWIWKFQTQANLSQGFFH